MYCEKCGKPLKEDGTCTCSESMKEVQKNTEKKGNNKSPNKMILMGAIALVIVIAVALLATSGTNKIALKDYINCEPEIIGLNGSASIDISSLFDRSALEATLFESMETVQNFYELEEMSDDELTSLMASASENAMAYEQIMDDIVITVWVDDTEVEVLENLSNGNVIKIEAKSLNPTNKQLGVQLKTGTAKFEIQGLTDGQAIDVFEEASLKVVFTGINGSGRTKLEWDYEFMPELEFDFMVEEGFNLTNGDEINILLNYDESLWVSYGYFPVEEWKTYTVEGLSELLTSIESIPEEQLLVMNDTVEAHLNELQESDWREGTSIKGITYVGSYLLTKNPDNHDMGPENMLELVYKVDAFENYAPEGGEDSLFSFYFCNIYEDVVLDEEGNLDLDESESYYPFASFNRRVCMGNSILWGNVLVNYDGYESFDELFEDRVNAYSDEYTYVTDIDTAN